MAKLTNERRRDICREFLALGNTALPSAMLLDADDDDFGDAWATIREIARRGTADPAECGLAQRVRMRADADGWRTAKVIRIPVQGEV